MRGSSCGYPHFWCVSIICLHHGTCSFTYSLSGANLILQLASNRHAVRAGSRIRPTAVGTAGSADRRRAARPILDFGRVRLACLREGDSNRRRQDVVSEATNKGAHTFPTLRRASSRGYSVDPGGISSPERNLGLIVEADDVHASISRVGVMRP